MPITTRRSIFPDLHNTLSGLADLADNLWWSWRPRPECFSRCSLTAIWGPPCGTTMTIPITSRLKRALWVINRGGEGEEI